MNRILYMLIALLEAHITSFWSCVELSVAYNVEFMNKLFSLMSFRKRT